MELFFVNFQVFHDFQSLWEACNLEGGVGVLPRKILDTKKAGEAISGRFCKDNFTFSKWTISENMHIVCISLGV